MTEETPIVLPDWLRARLEAGDLEAISLSASGVWRYQGERVEHPRVLALFSRSIRRTTEGQWVLAIGRFTYPIEVEDTALFVLDFDVEGTRLHLALSDATSESIDASAVNFTDDAIYAELSRGLSARFARTAHFEFAERFLVPDQDEVTLRIGATTLLRRQARENS